MEASERPVKYGGLDVKVAHDLEKPLVAIVGPTGIGKTALSLKLALEFQGEVVSADSRQIYRGLDVGTAKVTVEEQALVAHHLIDVVDPDETLSLAEFQTLAFTAIDGCHGRGRLPLLVGGTGQWVRAVLEGWHVPRVPPDRALRQALATEAERVGRAAFHARLAAVDPVSAARIDPRNTRRIIRALEVFHKTGQPISRQQQKSRPPYRVWQIGLTMPRQALYRRIDRRVEAMLDRGWVAEVERLRQQGYGWNLPAMSGLGYRQLGLYLQGQIRLEEAVAMIKKETRRFIRQQYNWFRLEASEIDWYDVSEDVEPPILHRAADFLGA
jgi:tRNA dimethylallyltransferase